METNYQYLIALTSIPKIGPILAKNLISYCGSVEAVFDESFRNLVKIPGIADTLAKSIRNAEVLASAKKNVDVCNKKGIRLLSFYEDEYPQRLKHYKDAPILLYTKGNIDFNPKRTVAVIGTREATAYGIDMAEKIVKGLRSYEVQIISGMAYGIDIRAHRVSIREGMSTLGVLGHGLDMMYPPTHKSVADKMLDLGGLVSEFGLGKGPDREHFPMRNRIIAALSDAVVVIESKKRGGSMITADLAFQYNKDVFALPGRVGDDFSEGCNVLIKSQKAALLQSAEDIAYVMMWEKDNATSPAVQRPLFIDLDALQKLIYELLKKHIELSVDEISYALKKKGSQLASTLLEMELMGVIKTLPGNRVRLS